LIYIAFGWCGHLCWLLQRDCADSVQGITGLGALNNLVLSHNKITEIPNLAALRNLKKLSLAHNQIRVLPDLCSHPLLEELRLNDNRIMKVSHTVCRCTLPNANSFCVLGEINRMMG
jgi:Leucine-rich repeat (LRR) protein